MKNPTTHQQLSRLSFLEEYVRVLEKRLATEKSARMTLVHSVHKLRTVIRRLTRVHMPYVVPVTRRERRLQ